MATNIYLQHTNSIWNFYFVEEEEEEEDMKVICSFLKRHTRYSRLI